MKLHKVFLAAVACILFSLQAFAQKCLNEMPLITVNENVTTVITASEPVRFVDISTHKVVGDQPINNTVRLKPKEGVEVNRDGDILAIDRGRSGQQLGAALLAGTIFLGGNHDFD